MTAAVALLAALVGGAASRAGASASDDGGVRVVLIGAEDSVAGLGERLRDLLGETSGPIEIARADGFRPDELFRTDGPEANRPAVWVSLEETRARVRAAGPGRQRFVFRDLAIARPLSELDRERIGQLVKAALGAVAEGGASSLARADAEAALGEKRAPAVVPPPPPPPPTLAAAAAPTPTPPVEAVDWHLGAFYGVDFQGREILHGPGLQFALTWEQVWWQPQLWLAIQEELPDDVNSPPDEMLSFTVHAQTARAGLSVEWAPRMWLGLGGGVDHVQTYAGSPNVAVPYDRFHYWIPTLRTGLRFGPVSFHDLTLSASAWLDLALTPIDQQIAGMSAYKPNRARPVLAFELWFR